MLLIIAVILVIIRLLLPAIILHYANKTLAELDGYKGHVEDIDLALIRGSYVAKGFYMDKIDSATNKPFPFVSVDVIDLSVEWNALVHGKIVGNIGLLNPAITFTREKLDPDDIKNDTTDFRKILKSFMPLKVNRFRIDNGKFHYIDSVIKPAVNLTIDSIRITALNLSNAEDTAALPSSIAAKANLYGGKFDLKMRFNPLQKYPTFDMNARLDNTELPKLNKFFKAYANIDVNKGTFGLYTEVAGKGKKFIGYVKPVIKDLDIVGPEDRKDSFFNKVWEDLTSVAEAVLENKKKDQIATKIPISGQYDDPTVKTWYAIMSILRNAFIQALYPSIDNQINLSSVKKVKPDEKKSFLQKIFGSGKKDDEKKSEAKKEEKKKEDNKAAGMGKKDEKKDSGKKKKK